MERFALTITMVVFAPDQKIAEQAEAAIIKASGEAASQVVGVESATVTHGHISGVIRDDKRVALRGGTLKDTSYAQI